MYCPHCGAQNDESFKFCKTCGADLSATLPLDAVVKPAGDTVEPSELDLVRGELDEEYEILEELGRGGMAIVFRAREKQLEREVAIKVLPFSLAFDKEFVERFQREARTSAKLEHPNIIPIYRVGKSGPRDLLRHEVPARQAAVGAAGRARRAAADGDPPGADPGRAARSPTRTAPASCTATSSPTTSCSTSTGRRSSPTSGSPRRPPAAKLTGTGMAIGTPHYMSPEQARAQQLDGRSDIYSLGVVAYQCLTGVVPYDGEDSFSIGYKHIMEELPVPALESDGAARSVRSDPEDDGQAARRAVPDRRRDGGGAGERRGVRRDGDQHRADPLDPVARRGRAEAVHGADHAAAAAQHRAAVGAAQASAPPPPRSRSGSWWWGRCWAAAATSPTRRVSSSRTAADTSARASRLAAARLRQRGARRQPCRLGGARRQRCAARSRPARRGGWCCRAPSRRTRA